MGGHRTAAIHELNLATNVWSHLKAHNREDGPFLKDKAGIVAYGKHMVCVFLVAMVFHLRNTVQGDRRGHSMCGTAPLIYAGPMSFISSTQNSVSHIRD